MTIQELYDFLGDFIEKHPKCASQKIMVKKLTDDSTWEEVSLISDTVVDSCPEYGSPLYFHSPSQEEATNRHMARMKEMEDDDDYYL